MASSCCGVFDPHPIMDLNSLRFLSLFLNIFICIISDKDMAGGKNPEIPNIQQSFFPSKFLSLNLYLVQLHIFSYPVVDSDSLVLKIFFICLGVCWGVCVELRRYCLGVGSLLPPRVLKKLELRLRHAWQVLSPASPPLPLTSPSLSALFLSHVLSLPRLHTLATLSSVFIYCHMPFSLSSHLTFPFFAWPFIAFTVSPFAPFLASITLSESSTAS